MSRSVQTCFMSCCRYSQCGGSPEEVVELLSENYVGLAQSANLLIQWLRVAGRLTHFIDIH